MDKIIVIQNSDRPVKDGFVSKSLNELMYTDTSNREVCAFQLKGAQKMPDGSVGIHLSLDLYYALGMQYADWRHKHARSLAYIQEQEVDQEVWRVLEKYAKDLEGCNFKPNGEVILEKGSGAYFLNPVLPKPESFFVLKICRQEDVDIDGESMESYAIDQFYFGEGATFEAPNVGVKLGSMMHMDPFAASVPVMRRPVNSRSKTTK